METSLAILSFVPTVSAWSFTWRNADNVPSTPGGHGAQECTKIGQAWGREYKWDGEDDPYWIFVYTNDNCSGVSAGRSPPDPWLNNASVDLHSYLVTTGSNAGPSSIPIASTTSTATSAPDQGDDSSDNLSGGAIAGIVIGVVVGVAIPVGVVLFFLLWRRRQQKAGAAVEATVAAQQADSKMEQPYTPQPYVLQRFAPQQYAPQVEYTSRPAAAEGHVSELSGENRAVEMSNTHQLTELPGHSLTPP